MVPPTLRAIRGRTKYAAAPAWGIAAHSRLGKVVRVSCPNTKQMMVSSTCSKPTLATIGIPNLVEAGRAVSKNDVRRAPASLALAVPCHWQNRSVPCHWQNQRQNSIPSHSSRVAQLQQRATALVGCCKVLVEEVLHHLHHRMTADVAHAPQRRTAATASALCMGITRVRFLVGCATQPQSISSFTSQKSTRSTRT